MQKSVEKGGSWSTIRHLCLQVCREPRDLILAFWLAATVYRQYFVESQSIQFPAKQLHGGRSFVSTIFTLFYPMGEYNACHQRCQLINKASQHRLDSHFAPFTGYPRNNLWPSEAALWCVRGFPMWTLYSLSEAESGPLTWFLSIVDWNTSSWGPPRTLPGGTSHRHWLKCRGRGSMSPSSRPHLWPPS